MTPETNTAGGPILVVDDDRDVREALTEMLEYRGYQVETAANGRDALDVLHAMEQPPSIIVLDLNMPVMDGYAFLDQRQKEPALAAIPVAVATAGYSVDTSRVTGAPVLRKPIDVSRLIRMIPQQQHASSA